MLQKEVIPAGARWVITLVGLLAGLLCALPEALHLSDRAAVYLPPLSVAAASVLAFTLRRPAAADAWLCALLVLPFIALMTGWLRWNFPDRPLDEFHLQNSAAVVCLLGLILPALYAVRHRSPDSGARWSAEIVDGLWRNTFALTITVPIAGLFWLVLLLWSKLFSMIGIGLFRQLFFENNYFPGMATGAVIAAGIVFCRSQTGASAVFRQLIASAAGMLLPLQATALLLFLACLPFTGLAIVPKVLSAATLLITMTLMLLTFSAMTGGKAHGASRWQKGITRLVFIAQCLAPLLAVLAGWALWVRIAQYGWTVDRVCAVALALITFTGSLLLLWCQRRAWSQGAQNTNTFIAIMLGIMAAGWFLLHTPLIDPWRIEIKNQLARLQRGEAKADEMQLYAFSHAGRRGEQALKMLLAHPQWLVNPAQQQKTLIQILAGSRAGSNPKVSAEALQRVIPLRAGSDAPPAGWWRSQAENGDTFDTCLLEKDACLVWMQDLNNDRSPEVLLYNRNQQEIAIYVGSGTHWRQSGSITLSERSEKALREGRLDTVAKPWRDLEIDGQRYPAHYFGLESQ